MRSTKLRKLDDQAKATTKLHAALVKAEKAPGSETRKMLTDVIGAAAGDGVKIGTIIDAYQRLHKLERAPEFEAEVRISPDPLRVGGDEPRRASHATRT